MRRRCKPSVYCPADLQSFIRMTSTDPGSNAKHALRQRAEKVARERTADASEGAEDLSPSAMLKVIQELRVHQIELEMQNNELRRTQAALDTTQACYFDFYDLAPVGYLTVSKQGLILHANLTAAALLNVTRSTLPKQAISRFIDRQDQDRFYLLHQQLLEPGTTQSCELQMVKQDGSRFFARMDAIATHGDDGAPVLRLVLTDITASKEAKAQRHALDLEILNSINAEIVVLDQYGVIRLVNEPWQRFALENGATPGTPAPHTGIGSNYLAACQTSLNAPLDNAMTAHDGIRAVLTGTLPSFTLEYPCHSPAQKRWFSMRALPLSKNPKDGITITHTDITRYKQAQDALRIAAVAFEVQEAIVVMNSQRQVLRVNQAFTHITGYSEQDMLGKTTAILRSTREPESSYEDVWRETVAHRVHHDNHWLQRKSGEDFFARYTITAIPDEQDHITHFLATFSDETLAMTQKQQRLQDEATQREALVREVHHRIKNNLQGMRGLLQQIGRQKPEIAEQMQMVMGHLQGISVIHGLQGRHTNTLVRLCELTHEIAKAASALWQTPIPVAVPSNWIPRIVAEKEAVALALVLNELIVNAIKHGGKAPGHVNVTLHPGHGAAGVEVTILNTGHLHNNRNHPKEQHHGLQLIKSLLPQVGVDLIMTQCGDQVCTLLKMNAPVLALDRENRP